MDKKRIEEIALEVSRNYVKVFEGYTHCECVIPEDAITDFAHALIARLHAEAVPDGWQLVPKVATDAMCKAAEHQWMCGSAVDMAQREYKAMLAAAPQPPITTPPDDERDAFKHACWLLMKFSVYRYLMSNAYGRWNGAEKAQRHMELCQFYVAAARGCEVDDVRLRHDDDYQSVRDKTRELTDNMDETIGFPLEDDPDYDSLAPLFFDRFFSLAQCSIAAHKEQS